MDKDRERLLLYLYDEMSTGKRAEFETELQDNAHLREILAEEEVLHRLHPVGRAAAVPDEFLQESRILARAALRREKLQKTLLARLAEGLRVLPRCSLRLAGAAALLLLGLLVGRASVASGSGPVTPASLIGPDDLEIVDLRIARIGSGLLRLTFDAVSRVEVEGDIRDASVQSVLTAALGGGMEHSARLQTVELLGQQTASAQVRRALIHALLHDQNPGVRLQAVSALGELAGDEEVRQALRVALQQDLNAGVRIGAIDALRDVRDPTTLMVLGVKAKGDESQYIRRQARRIMEAWNAEAEREI